MKFKPHSFIQYALVGTGAVVLLFVLLGVFAPTYSFEVKTQVNAPLEKTFATFNDTVQMSNWVAHVEEVQLASGKANEKGCIYHITVAGRDKSYVITKEITNFQLNRLVAYHLKNEALNVDTEVHFVTNGASTDIIAHHTVEGRDAYWRSMLLFLRGQIRDKMEGDLERLKVMMERQELVNS